MTHRGLICWKTAMASLLCLLSIVASACGNAVLPDRAGPSATDEEVNDLVRGNNVLAFDLYRTLSAGERREPVLLSIQHLNGLWE